MLFGSSASGLSLLHTGQLCYSNQWMSHLSTSDAVSTFRCFKVSFLAPLRVFRMSFDLFFPYLAWERGKKSFHTSFSRCHTNACFYFLHVLVVNSFSKSLIWHFSSPEPRKRFQRPLVGL